MTMFHLGSRHAPSIQAVGDDMAAGGGIHSPTSPEMAEIRVQIDAIRKELSRLQLPLQAHAAALGHLAAAASETERSEPDGRLIGCHVRKAAEALNDAGALANGAAALAPPLVRIAELLGPAGHTLLAGLLSFI
jgi:hypothetical protein